MLDGGVFYCECANMDDEPIEYVPKKDGQSVAWLIARNIFLVWVMIVGFVFYDTIQRSWAEALEGLVIVAIPSALYLFFLWPLRR